MKKLLYVTANPKATEDSSSLSVGKAFLDTYKTLNPSDEIIELDLYNTYIPAIDQDVLNAWGKLQSGQSFSELSSEEQAKITRMSEVVDQFIAADNYIFVTPMWNFSFPSKVKDYIDNIATAGKTFKYTEKGPVGLLQNKKMVHIQASGGIYSQGPGLDSEFSDRYLQKIATFIGISDYQSVFIEGAAMMPDQAEAILDKAKEDAREAARNMSGDLVMS
ncbi:MAG: FMN-dependent NADH-azoreductase [Paenibacillaceae bacterium]